jgi:hypothetical protein
MVDGKNTFDTLNSIERHIEALQPLLPKQAMVCIGEYPIKTLLQEPIAKRDGTLTILIEKSSEDIYTWIPKDFNPYLVLGFEDANMDTHFWYSVQPKIMKDNSIIENLKMKPVERLHSAIIFSSIWEGIGSATLPTLISKFKAEKIDSLSIAVLPSRIQPPDAHFNTFATIQLCLKTDGSSVLLLDRDQIENYTGIDRKGKIIRGHMVVNYLLNMLLAKESLVSEISELSRTFNTKIFSSIIITGASYKIYGSFENMLNAAWLKPLLRFDLPSASLLYVLLRMPASLKDKLPRSKIELAIADWFKDKTNFQSTYITEPIYTDDMTDRIDAVLFVGGFDMTAMFDDMEQKVKSLKNKAVEGGFMTEDWQLITPETNEEPKAPVYEIASRVIKEELPVLEKPNITIEVPIIKVNRDSSLVAVNSESSKQASTPFEPLQTGESVPTTVEQQKIASEPIDMAESNTRKREKKIAAMKINKTKKAKVQKKETSV